MLVRTIENKNNGSKFEITLNTDGFYDVTYFEYFKSCGWRKVSTDGNYSKECIEYDFNIIL